MIVPDGIEKEIFLNKGAIIGAYAYLTRKKNLNTVICKTATCELYLLTDAVLTKLLHNEEMAKQTLWKQIAVNIVLAQFHGNGVSLFAFYGDTEISKMCHAATYREYDEAQTLCINNSYALLLDGAVEMDDGCGEYPKIYTPPDLLLTGDNYTVSANSKLLFLGQDLQANNVTPMAPTRRASGMRYRGRTV